MQWKKKGFVLNCRTGCWSSIIVSFIGFWSLLYEILLFSLSNILISYRIFFLNCEGKIKTNTRILKTSIRILKTNIRILKNNISILQKDNNNNNDNNKEDSYQSEREESVYFAWPEIWSSWRGCVSMITNLLSFLFLKNAYGYFIPLRPCFCGFLFAEGTPENFLWIIVKTDPNEWNGRVLVSFPSILTAFLPL